ncbi:MAG: WYL domain-containing protein [Lentisphaerae bacterium]|nr:WYL domain-containing protein [Lentisphaerota bacterium]
MKNLSRPQHHRLRRILELIRDGTRTGAYANARGFCTELGVCRRTILRDLDFLRDEERAPIAYDGQRKGYYMTDATWRLPPVELSREEVFSFAVARKLLAAFRGTPMEVDMRSVLSKIAGALDGNVTVDLDALTERFTVVGDDYAVQDPRIWGELARHIERRETVRMDYEKFNGQRATYCLTPYHLIAYHGDWYVLGAHTDRNEPATFAVSRIQSLAGTGETFSIPNTFSARDHVDKAFGVVGGAPLMRVRLYFTPGVSGYIRHRIWHPSQRLRERRDGGVERAFETTGWKELVRWILSWQPDVQVLSPKALRERVRDKLRQALAQKA